ncbi:GAF domain-containing protein [Deinococcus ruber]|nr:GAF domain-containing protein [Deinococcus ruber]
MSEPSAVEPTAGRSLSQELQLMTEALAATSRQDEIFHIIQNAALRVLKAIGGAVLLLGDAGSTLNVAASQGHAEGEACVWQHVPSDHTTPAGVALMSNQALYFEQQNDLLEAYPQFSKRADAGTPVARAVLPMYLDEQPLGVLIFDFQEPHDFPRVERRFLPILAAQCAVALGRARAVQNLEAQVAGRTRQLNEERAALDAFVDYSELIGTETDVSVLAQRAVEVLRARFADCSGGYYGRSGTRWTLRSWTGDLNERPDVLARLHPELPSDMPFISELLSTREFIFTERWDAEHMGTENGETYGTVAAYPVIVGPVMEGFIVLGLKDASEWNERDRAIFRTVGRGLTLALERSEQSVRLAAQNAELEARTQALEALMQLTQELGTDTEPLTLIQKAQELTLDLLPPGFAAYYEPQDHRWRLLMQTGDAGSAFLQAAIDEGFPIGHTPSFDVVAQTGEPAFIDAYIRDIDVSSGEANHVAAHATLPLLVEGQFRGIFNLPIFRHHQWTAADRALLITTVQYLGLVLARAQSYDALAQSNRELQASNSELEAFTYSASHDLRTPVRHVMAFAELAQKALEKTPNDKAQQYLGIVKQGAQRMNALIDGMLVLSRSGRQELDMRPVDLNELVTQARRDVEAEFGKHPVRWHIGELPQVQGDRDLLQQVVSNLLSNAVKYSSQREVSEVQIWSERTPSGWRVCVQDNGVGFDARYTDRLFGIFQRLHSERDFQGTGVGLATVKRIVLKHGGQVFATSHAPSGATFGFTVPAGR